jgi:hypothetical protein
MIVTPEFCVGQEKGMDRVRSAVIGDKNIRLTYFEEAYTSENWLVRIYRVVHPDDRALSGRSSKPAPPDYINRQAKALQRRTPLKDI